MSTVENKEERRQGEFYSSKGNSLGSPFSSPVPPDPPQQIKHLEAKLKCQIEINRELLRVERELLERINTIKAKRLKDLCR